MIIIAIKATSITTIIVTLIMIIRMVIVIIVMTIVTWLMMMTIAKTTLAIKTTYKNDYNETVQYRYSQ